MRDNIAGGAQTETTLLILLALYTTNHGYGIMQFVKEKTNGRVDLGAGTLYGAINTLGKKGWIEKVQTTEEGKKIYIITEMGKEIVNKEIERLKEILLLAYNIIGDVDFG
nr:PadR family transcriptional regulator [uncultured Clostridium sp.]